MEGARSKPLPLLPVNIRIVTRRLISNPQTAGAQNGESKTTAKRDSF
jgi:hypothetical protein